MEVYRLSGGFPRREMYRLTSQLTGAAVSVPGNIAEGHARSTPKDFAYFLSVARGSLMETETYIMLAVRLGYLLPDAAASALATVTEVSKMLTSLRKRVLESARR